MMNEEPNSLEARLSRQPPREIPAHWRAQILTATQTSTPATSRPNRIASFFILHSSLLRWSALAAVWVVILVLNHSARDNQPVSLAQASLPSPELRQALREQRKLLAELIDTATSPTTPQPADRPKRNQPHSQLQINLATV